MIKKTFLVVIALMFLLSGCTKKYKVSMDDFVVVNLQNNKEIAIGMDRRDVLDALEGAREYKEELPIVNGTSYCYIGIDQQGISIMYDNSNKVCRIILNILSESKEDVKFATKSQLKLWDPESKSLNRYGPSPLHTYVYDTSNKKFIIPKNMEEFESYKKDLSKDNFLFLQVAPDKTGAINCIVISNVEYQHFN